MRYLRTILAVLIGLGIIVLIFVLVSRGFNSDKAAPSKTITLLNYANSDAQAILYTDGPISYDTTHYTSKITVSETQVTIDIIQGYQGSVVKTQSYPNNQQAYAAFLQALQHLNFTKGDNSTKNQDERGYCATGERYIYQLMDNGNSMFRYWSTSCGQGTFNGMRESVRNLFQAQIPSADYRHLTAGLPL